MNWLQNSNLKNSDLHAGERERETINEMERTIITHPIQLHLLHDLFTASDH